VHPDHGVIGSLRVALADMGYATLSIQMPVLAADARVEDYYPALFPEAAARIAAAASWLQTKGQRRLVLVSHSLGAWMSQYYLEKAKDIPFAAWVAMGRGGPMPKLSLPVLDVYGEKDNGAVLSSAASRHATRQVRVAGADHFYNGREAELAATVNDFIGRY
jgi:alpha/beta superfamily hydrolase